MVDSGANTASGFSSDGVRHRSPVARALFGDLVQFFDFLLVIATSVGVAYAYHNFALQLGFDFQNYAAAGIVGATGLTALLRRDGYYEYDQLISSSRSFRAILSRWVMVVLSLLAFGFALKVSENFSRVWLFSWSATVVITISASRVVSSLMLRNLSRDGKAFARLTRPRGLHPRIQRQQVGLERDFVDDADDLTHLARRIFDLGHGILGLADHFAAGFRIFQRAADRAVGLTRGIGGALHGFSQGIDRRRGLFQAGRLLFRTTRQIVRGLRNLARPRADAFG